MEPHTINIISILFAVLCVVSIWFKNHNFTWLIGIAFVLQGLFLGTLEPISLIPIFALYISLYRYRERTVNHWLYFIIVISLGLLFGLHSLPGFNNWHYADFKLNETVRPFSLWFNFDKMIFGFLVLSFLFKNELISSAGELLDFFKKFLPSFLGGISVIFLVGYLIGYVELDIKWTPVFFVWAIKNLFFTVIAEEMMFRGIIQKKLENTFLVLCGNQGKYYAVFIAGVLFGLAHFSGGMNYVFLSSMAGVLYGYIYLHTGKIEGALLAHFLLNSIHFCLFSYPYLEQ